MKTLKEIVIMLAVVSVLFASVSAYAGPAEFAWGISKATVIRLMGQEGEEDNTSSEGNVLLRYYNQPISDFTGTLVFAFRNDALFARIYAFPDDADKTIYDYLGEALDIKYGASTDDSGTAIDGFAALGMDLDEDTLERVKESGTITYKSWKSDKQKNIILAFIKDDHASATALFYIQPKEQRTNKKYNFDGL